MNGKKTIVLGGEQRTVDLNLYFAQFLIRQLNCELDEMVPKWMELAAENNLRAIAFIIYCGLLGHLEAEAIFTHDITLKKVMGWIGEAREEDLNGVYTMFKDINEIPSASTEQIDAHSEELKKKELNLVK